MKTISTIMMVLLLAVSFSVSADPSQTTPLNRAQSSTNITVSQMDNFFASISNTANAANKKTISVLDFGVIPNSNTDQTTLFNAAIGQIGTYGTSLFVPRGSFIINTAPTAPTQIKWNFDLATSIVSSVGWPSTKIASSSSSKGTKPVSTWIVASPTFTESVYADSVATSVYDITIPSGSTGSFQAVHANGLNNSANGQNDGIKGLNLINSTVKDVTGATGSLIAFTATVNSNSAAASDRIAYRANGAGAVNGDTAFSAYRDDLTYWVNGVLVKNAINGIVIQDSTVGLKVGTTATPTASTTAIIGKQMSSNGAGIVIQRKDDVTPLGLLFDVQNSNGTSSLANIDANGNAKAKTITVNGAATPGALGTLIIGATTSNTASAGTAVLPSNPVRFINAYLDGTLVKIPVYY